jgi:RNA polymerase sigma factor (TIGR02999 family)
MDEDNMPQLDCQMEQVSQILELIEAGDPNSSHELLPIVYEELRKLARSRMASELPGQTLQATALVHEAYLRIAGNEDELDWNSRGHFFGAAAEAMRRILIENARRKKTKKHGGDMQRIDFDSVDLAVGMDEETLLYVDEALEKLSVHDETGAELVKLRFFTGLTNVEAAKILGLSERTAKRTWAYSRAWLYRELQKG